MNWEIVNGITGIISAICAFISIVYFSTHKKQRYSSTKANILTTHQLMSFALLCSGWVLCCFSFLWLMEPYGSYMNDDDYQHFFGAVLAFPAFIIFIYGADLLQNIGNDE